jgi:recombinational DNA repair protein RecT
MMMGKQLSQASNWLTNPEVAHRIQSALAGWMTGDEFIAQMLISLQHPGIRECSEESKFKAAHVCASLQLLPSLDQVALVPRKNHVHAMPQWQGYKAIMERHPNVLEVEAFLVHKSDQYRIHNGVIDHEYDYFDPKRRIESVRDLVGGYLVINYTDGRHPKYFPVTADYIAKCQACAETQNVWVKWFEQQALKTIFRAGYARRVVPVDPLVNKALQEASAAEDVAMGNDPDRLELKQAPSNLDGLKAEWKTGTAEDAEVLKAAPDGRMVAIAGSTVVEPVKAPSLEPVVEPAESVDDANAALQEKQPPKLATEPPEALQGPIPDFKTVDEFAAAIRDIDDLELIKAYYTVFLRSCTDDQAEEAEMWYFRRKEKLSPKQGELL